MRSIQYPDSMVGTGTIKTESLSRMQWLAMGLALITGVFHVYAGILEGRIPVALAGVGFFGAIGVFLLDYRRQMLYLLGIGYTAVQIPLWYLANVGEFTPIGYADKVIQILLIGILALLYWSTGD